MSDTKSDPVEILLDKAKACSSPGEALHFSQAALNAANALRTLQDIESIKISINKGNH